MTASIAPSPGTTVSAGTPNAVSVSRDACNASAPARLGLAPSLPRRPMPVADAPENATASIGSEASSAARSNAAASETSNGPRSRHVPFVHSAPVIGGATRAPASGAGALAVAYRSRPSRWIASPVAGVKAMRASCSSTRSTSIDHGEASPPSACGAFGGAGFAFGSGGCGCRSTSSPSTTIALTCT